jgi:hypothetical protein
LAAGRLAPRLGRLLALALVLWPAGPAGIAAGEPSPPADPLEVGPRLRLGVGDRLSLVRDGRRIPTDVAARELGLDPAFVQIWLTRDWKEEWAPRGQLAELASRGATPVIVHYFFGDDLSRERFERERDAWYTSLWRLARLVRGDAPVLVILEPEWNQPAPQGETSLADWAGFADDLRAAAQMIRRDAPNALVGTCPGDFPGPPGLEQVLGPASRHLDFLAFQEMRAATGPGAGKPGYLDVGSAAAEYATSLSRAFGKPLLLGYVAVSSGGGWEQQQEQALESLVAQRAALRRAGVFGAIYFQLVDDPQHRGFFGSAEKHFGLVDERGRRKPAWKAFLALGS